MKTYCLIIILTFTKLSYFYRGFCKSDRFQWHTQSLSDADIPVWGPKLGSQIKGELMQNNNHLIISSTQMRLHVLRHFI